MIVEIKGGQVQIDDSDAGLIDGYRWSVMRAGRSVYAKCKVGGKTTLMHRLLTNPPAGLVVDHRDGDGLNNLRSNLRVCTHSQNHCNLRRTAKRGGASKSSYKGVAFAVSRNLSKPWFAHIGFDHRVIRLGYFATEEDAARAYDEAAVRLHGEFAATNFPQE